MTNASTVNLKIDEKVQGYAKIYASLIQDEYQRKRAYGSLIALYAFVDTLDPSYNVQKSMTLFRNPQINEQYEIADTYVNGWHIDVRVVTGGNAVLLPKVHYESDIVPDFYIVVKIDSTLENAELIGAVDAKNVEKEPFDYHYYSVPFSSLINYNEFLSKIDSEKKVSHNEEEHELFRNSYLSLLDNNLDIKTKNRVLKHLFECNVCRTEFCCFTGFEMVCSNTSKYPEILEDHTLGYIGAQNVEDKKYDGKEETIYIGTEEQPEENIVEDTSKNVESKNEEATVSAILDDLFDIDEGSVPDEIVEEISEDSQESENAEAKEIITESEPVQAEEISSLDDILEEVSASSGIQLESNEQADLVVENHEQDDKDLQLIDDSVFLDVQSKYPEVVSENGELKIIQDTETESNSALEKIDDEEEFVVISENSEEELVEFVSDENNLIIEENNSETSEIEDVQDEIKEVYPTDEELVINDTADGEIENIDDEIIDEATMLSKDDSVQKVIVDYDEYGEPIYSYITEIDDNQMNEDETFEIKEEEFEEYPEDDETSGIEDASETTEEEEYESVYSDEDEESEKLEENDVTNETSDDEDFEQNEKESSNEENQEEQNLANDEEYTEEEKDEEYSEEDSYLSDEVDENTGEEESEYEENEEDMQLDSDENQNEEYEDDEEYEEDEEDEEEGNVKKSSPVALIISLLVLIALAGGGAFYFLTKGKTTEEQAVVETVNENVFETAENPAVNDMFEQPVGDQQENVAIETTEMQNQEQQSTPVQEDVLPVLPEAAASSNVKMPELTESDLIKPQRRSSNGDVNKTIVNAFATSQSPVSLRALNWFCASSLFSDMNFKNYLQTIDDSLKQNLKNNFMNLVESSPKDSVAAKFAVDNRGNLKKVIISESSGSDEIDNVVLQSINETFEREKSQILNDTELKQDMYYLKVVIKL